MSKPAAFDPHQQPAYLNGVTRADGRPFYNDYLWPTESWWLGHEHRSFHSRWHFGYIALSDGRFCVDGHAWQIHENSDYGRRNNFPTREEAVRASCARMIRVMRASKNWSCQYGGMTGERLAFAINWALQTCARACHQPPPRPIKLFEPPVFPAIPDFPPPPKPFTLPASPYADAPATADLFDSL